MPDVDEVYLIRSGDSYGPKEVDGLAVTRAAAERRRSEIATEERLKDVEIEHVELYT